MRFLTLILLFSSFFLAHSQKQTHTTNPIYLGTILIDDVSEKSMAETCLFYQLTEAADEDGYKVFISKDGTKVRFKFEEDSKNAKPVVEVITKEKDSAIKKILSQTGYHKANDGYIRGSQFSNTITRCVLSNSQPKTLLFKKVNK